LIYGIGAQEQIISYNYDNNSYCSFTPPLAAPSLTIQNGISLFSDYSGHMPRTAPPYAYVHVSKFCRWTSNGGFVLPDLPLRAGGKDKVRKKW
jgi:hypothetical protein